MDLYLAHADMDEIKKFNVRELFSVSISESSWSDVLFKIYTQYLLPMLPAPMLAMIRT